MNDITGRKINTGDFVVWSKRTAGKLALAIVLETFKEFYENREINQKVNRVLLISIMEHNNKVATRPGTTDAQRVVVIDVISKKQNKMLTDAYKVYWEPR